MMWNPNYMNDQNQLPVTSSQMSHFRSPTVVSNPVIANNSQNTEVLNAFNPFSNVDNQIQVNSFLYQNQATWPSTHVPNMRPTYPTTNNQIEVNSTENIEIKKQMAKEFLNCLKLKLRRQKKTIGDLNAKLQRLTKPTGKRHNQLSERQHRDPCEMIANWGIHLSQMQRMSNEENNKKFTELTSLLEKDRRERMEFQNPFSNWRCSVCLESDERQQLVSLPCGHVFELRCAKRCLQESGLCPQCRRNYTKHDLRYLYPN